MNCVAISIIINFLFAYLVIMMPALGVYNFSFFYIQPPLPTAPRAVFQFLVPYVGGFLSWSLEFLLLHGCIFIFYIETKTDE